MSILAGMPRLVILVLDTLSPLDLEWMNRFIGYINFSVGRGFLIITSEASGANMLHYDYNTICL